MPDSVLLMIPKKALPSSPSHFRPTCLIPFLVKLMEYLLLRKSELAKRSTGERWANSMRLRGSVHKGGRSWAFRSAGITG